MLHTAMKLSLIFINLLDFIIVTSGATPPKLNTGIDHESTSYP